jgi:hypothetical protein
MFILLAAVEEDTGSLTMYKRSLPKRAFECADASPVQKTEELGAFRENPSGQGTRTNSPQTSRCLCMEQRAVCGQKLTVRNRPVLLIPGKA